MKEAPQRNSPCPCGSGKKYKKCCGQPGLAKHTFTQVDGNSSLINRIQSAVSPATSSIASLKDRISRMPRQPSQTPTASSEEKE
jgi:hypothetical protein